ncbi:MAG TPA: hypothetical protein VFU23_06190 [Gemmatimonadales bacterium]|nr:hypothetical protein [Gemmatimonadales bacterium]
MPPSDMSLPAQIQQRIAAAATELASAEQDLRTSLEAIPPTIRSEKRIISAALQAALEKLSAAKRQLDGVLTAEP